jgi:dynein heavy chain
MVALRKKGMKERHWDQVSAKAKQQIQPTPDLNFMKLIDLGLMEHLDACMEIGERAYKEYTIETMLKGMKKQWEDINFDLMPYKGISFIIRGYDEINAVLDEHIVNT